MTDLNSGDGKHPADEIALALLRAGGILSSLSNCYDAKNSEFAIDASFLAEAIRSAEQILFKANDRLAELYHDYNLEPIIHMVAEDQLGPELLEPLLGSEFTMPPSEHELVEEGSQLSRRMDATVGALPAEAPPKDSEVDRSAQTYEEFFERLTGT